MGVWPAEDEVISWIATLSNRGRWGEEDDLGTLNLVTNEVRRAAAATVSLGVTVSCGLDLVTAVQAGDIHGAARRYMVRTGRSTPAGAGAPPGSLTQHGQRYDACAEYIGLVFHGPNVTHLDALCHTTWDARLYNDVPVGSVSVERGADRLAVTAASAGITTRAVLLDAARYANRRWLEPGTAVRAAELDEIARAHHVEVRPGDAVLLRTGYGRQRREDGVLDTSAPRAGWHPDALLWMREHDVALIGSDGFNEALPNPYAHMTMPVHIVGQVGLGLWLLDNLDLEEAATVAAGADRWESMLCAAPLRVPGGTGSPLNPLLLY
jgi:kynurenine formamidase